MTELAAIGLEASGAGRRPSARRDALERGPVVGANTIVSSRPQLPPNPALASQMTIGRPPATGAFFSFPSAKKAIHWLSGEKKGLSALDVP